MRYCFTSIRTAKFKKIESIGQDAEGNRISYTLPVGMLNGITTLKYSLVISCKGKHTSTLSLS